jgi:hypothetical protein
VASGSPQTFSVVVNDPSGVADLKTLHLLFHTTTANQTNACSIYYSVGNNQLFVYNDAGSTLSVALMPGAAGTVSNTQCSLSGTGASVSKVGNTLTLNVAVTFAVSFTGTKTAYVYASGNNGLSTGWVLMGTWTN